LNINWLPKKSICWTSFPPHSCILNILGICLSPLCLITNFCPLGNLYDAIHNPSIKIEIKTMIKIGLNISAGMNHLHSQDPPIAHLDLKSPNILVVSWNPSDSCCAKIADFGTAERCVHPFTRPKVDNPMWLAPEIFVPGVYDHKVDIYSFGIICWELTSRKRFFGEEQFTAVMRQMLLDGYRPTIPQCPRMYSDLIVQAWAQQPSKRLSFQGLYALLTKLWFSTDR